MLIYFHTRKPFIFCQLQKYSIQLITVMSFETLNKNETINQNNKLYQDPDLTNLLEKFELLKPDQALIFMVYDPRNGDFTHVHKFTTKRAENGLEIEYKDNENFMNKGTKLEDYEDYDMTSSLTFLKDGDFVLNKASDALWENITITRENWICDIEDSLIELDKKSPSKKSLSFDTIDMLNKNIEKSNIIEVLKQTLSKLESEEITDEEVLLHRFKDDLYRSVEQAEFTSAEVFQGSKKEVAKMLYEWGKNRRENHD
jgi:hypothetical protein